MLLRLFFLVILYSLVYSQSYPFWFLYPLKLDCNDLTVGYAISSYYADTTASAAFKNGCENYAKNKLAYITGGQGFKSTEIGAIWMGSDISLTYDTSLAKSAEKSLTVIDSFTVGRFEAVLLSSSSCNVPSEYINLTNVDTPKWIENLPLSSRSIYAVGISETYYYESSSWLTAETNARVELAKTLNSEISALGKQTELFGQITNRENISAMLTSCSVVERWIDVNSNLYYVLMEMKL